MKRSFAGVTLLALSIMILVVSAFVYDQASQTTTQTVINVASISLGNAALGNINEGETILYTPSNTSALDDILDITTAATNVYLYFDTDLEGQTTNYDTYQIEVIVSSAPGGSSLSGTIATLTMAAPDTATGITLDVIGNYILDFQVTTTAQAVGSNQDTTVNITVTVENA